MEADYLDRALQNFSGYIAIDELYDGPFCVLSLVDNRTFTRLVYRVLEHDPTQDDIRLFLRDFRVHLVARGLQVKGITTDCPRYMSGAYRYASAIVTAARIAIYGH